jgi:hypothetical protein
MTLPPIWSPNQGSGSWWHTQEKGGLITSQPSHLCDMFVDNVFMYGHQAMTVSLNYSLEEQKTMKLTVKGNERDRKQ